MKKKKEVIGTLYQELTCPACGKLYSNPYLLPCNHSLCDTCLSKEIKHEKKGQICIKCPSCKESFCFNQEDEVKFPENYLLNNTVTRYRQEAFNANTENAKKKKRNAKGRINPQQTQILCQLCDEKDNHIAMKKCVNCNLNFCEKCLRKIHKNKAFLSHVLIDPSSYTDDQIKCFYHPFTNLKHYCVQDNLPICDECKLSTHRNHRLYSLDLAFQCEVAEMQKNVSRFVEVKANYEKCFQQLKLMKTNIELNAMQRTAEVTKEFNFLQEALKLQEQTIKNIMKSENTKKQNEVDNFIESASKLMLQLEGLILYAMEAFKETSPAVFLQTSAQINKRLTESMLYVTPSKSLAVIPFEDFEFNVDHLKDAINALSSQICDTASEYLCSEDFQKIQALNVPNKMKKLKVTGNIHEILPNLYCPSFTSKVHASLTSPKLDLCSCISRSCTAAFSLDEHNSDFHTNVSSSSECRPKCASENNVTISSTYVDSCSHVADSSICNSEYTSKPDATSNETLTDSSTYVKCSSKHSAPKMDVNSNAPNMICCESLPNFEHHNLQYDSETPLSKNQTFPLLCCSKSDTSISPGGICKCIEIPEFKDANNTLCNASGIDPCQNTSTTPTKILHIDRNQESGDCQSPTEITKFMCISGNTISAWQCQQQFNNESVISGFNVDVHQKEIYFSNRISSPKTADGKHPINNDSLDLLKDHTISSPSGVLPDSDTGNNSSYNSLCLPLGRENGESTSPLSQLIAPCTFTNAEPPQADYVQNGSEDFGKSTCSKDEKGISSNCVVSDGSSKSQMSNNACSSFSSVRSHGEFGNNLCCKSLNSSCERKCSVETTHNSQNQQQYSSDGCKMDFREQKVHCSLGTKSNSAKTHSFTNSDISKPLQFWNTNNIVHNTRSRHRFGGQSYYRNPKLLTKSKSFVRSNHKSQTGCNVRFSQSAQYQSQSTTNFEINSNTPTEDSIKSHSSNHLYSIHFPRTQPLRNGHCTCPKLRPQSGIHISTDHKKQCHAYTSKNKITVNKGTRNDPLLSQMNNVILTCNVGKLQLFDNRVQFDTENNETAQISSHHFLNEPLNTLSQELSEAPTIYKHTVDGTSAKVKWLFPAEEHTVFFFELQFQEIISIDKEMAIPQYQAGVFSGIRRTNFVATNLNTNSEYLFRVRAVNVTGKGPWSQPYKILTVRGTMHHDMDTKEDAVSIKGVKVTIRRSS